MARRVLGRDPMALPSAHPGSWRKVLVVIEERALSEVLAEAITDAGHVAAQAEDAAAAERAAAEDDFDAAIVDLDTRAREGVALIARLRALHPRMTIIALLPCGGLPAATRSPVPMFHLALEKPARLSAILSAVDVAHAAIRN